nr:reverse transcriptase domain-containing protein [Tanacetum cinerariifolium]
MNLEDKSGLDASAKLTRAKLNKRSGDAGLSKDKSSPELSPEFRRSRYVEGHVRSGVISSVLAQRHLRVIRQRQAHSASKSQRTPSKNKEPTHLRRSRRLEDQSMTKEKARRERSKSRRRRSGHQETSSDSKHEEAFMHGHGHPELAKKLNEKIPKRVDEMFKRVRVFIRGEVVAGSAEMVRPSQGDKGDTSTPLTKTPKEILAMESVSFLEPPPLIGTPKKQNLNKFYDYHGDRGYNTNNCYQLKKQIEEAVALGKSTHLVKDIRQTNQRNKSQGRNNVKEPQCQHPVKTQKMQDSDDTFFRRNISSPRSNRSSSNYGKGRKKEDSEEVFTIGHERTDEYVKMGATTDFASWKQSIRLYCQGKEKEVNILKSIDEGPFQMGTVRETLAEGTEGAPHLETIHAYYVRFAKLINDMRNIKMTMSRMQLNSKFVNNMLPEWGRFVTTVKLNMGLRDSNYDQLYAYLKQHEAHTNENKMMLDRFTQHIVDPLALMSNVSHQQPYLQSSTTPPSTYVPPHLADNAHLDSGLSPIDNLIENLTNTLALLTQSYKTFLPQTNNQLRTSSNTRNQVTVQDGRVVVQNVPGDRIEVRGPIHKVEVQLGNIARNCTQPKHPQNSDYFKDKMLLMQAQENGVGLDEEQLLFLVGGQANAIDKDVDEQPVQDLALNVDNVFQADDCDVFDSDVDEAPTAQTMFMKNLSSANPVYDEFGPSYDSDILSEVHDHDHYQDVICERRKEHEMHDNVQLSHIVDSHADYTSDSNMIMHDQYVKDNAVPGVHSNVSSVPNDAYIMIYNDMYEPHAQFVSKTSLNTVVENSLTAELATYKEQVELYERRARPKPYYNELNKVPIGYKNPLCLTRAKQVQPALYNGHEIIKDNHVPAIVHNTEDTLEIAEIARRKMNDKMKDPECVNHKVKIAPHDYSKENFLATFTPHKQLTPGQIFWSQDLIKLKTEALKEQTIASRPTEALMVYPLNTPATLVPRARCLELEAELSNLCDKSHNDNHNELLNRFSNLEVHQLNLQLKYQNFKDSFRNNPPTPAKDTPDFDSVFVIEKMQASLQGKDNVIKQLKKQISHLQETRSEADRTLDFKALDSQITQLTDKVTVLQAQNDLFRAENKKIKQHYKELNNREAHLDYLMHLKENVKTIREIVEEARVVRPLDSSIVSACRYTKHSQELLEYAIDTCPQDSYQRDKKHAPAPLIKKKQVTFAKQCDASNSNTHKHVTKLNTQKTNVPVPPSTRVNRCTDASGSQPRSNTKKNRISPIKGVNKMKVEEHPRTNKSHLKTTNRVDSNSRFK